MFTIVHFYISVMNPYSSLIVLVLLFRIGNLASSFMLLIEDLIFLVLICYLWWLILLFYYLIFSYFLPLILFDLRYLSKLYDFFILHILLDFLLLMLEFDNLTFIVLSNIYLIVFDYVFIRIVLTIQINYLNNAT